MKNTISIKGIQIGEGTPKICVPMVGKTIDELKAEAAFIKTIDFDLVEWRVDFFEDVQELEKVKGALEEIRAILPSTPLLFTFRSAEEGGEKEVSLVFYAALNKFIAKTGLIDLIDIELQKDDKVVKELVETAHMNHVYVILSNHDFEKTPSREEIISRLRKAQDLGGDLPKIAVMPTKASDVLTLLDATVTMKEKYADRPIITMSMAGKGLISRLAGEVFGSAITFGAAKKASAPGQIQTTQLKQILELIHTGL